MTRGALPPPPVREPGRLTVEVRDRRRHRSGSGSDTTEVEVSTSRRPSESSGALVVLPKPPVPLPRPRVVSDETWTEITKDLVVREALERFGYPYEETEYIFYIPEFLNNVSLQAAFA